MFQQKVRITFDDYMATRQRAHQAQRGEIYVGLSMARGLSSSASASHLNQLPRLVVDSRATDSRCWRVDNRLSKGWVDKYKNGPLIEYCFAG